MDELKEIKQRLVELEKNSHPPIGLKEFDGYREVIARIEELEEIIKKGDPKSPLPYSEVD